MTSKAIEREIYVIHPEVILNKTKYLFLYGSRGSGKSTTAGHKILFHALNTSNAKILVTRKTMPSLRVTCWELIKSLLSEYGIEAEIKNTVHEIHFFNGSAIYFIPFYLSSGERNERLKSTTWDWIWVEEPTEFSFEDIKELNATLRGQRGWRQMIFTFNPPRRATHWIYSWFDLKSKSGDAEKIHFYYLDNPFLPEDYKKELEALQEIDEGLYKRYTLGQWRVDTQEELIYKNWLISPLDHEPQEWIGGMDFGFNNPSVFLLIGLDENHAYIHREIYVRHYTNTEFGEKVINLLQALGIPLDIPIYADAAEPARIEELFQMGLNVYPASKDVLKGIDTVQSFYLYVDPECVNTISELESYCWLKDKDGNLLDKPINIFNHSMDALRYALYTHLKEAGSFEIF